MSRTQILAVSLVVLGGLGLWWSLTHSQGGRVDAAPDSGSFPGASVVVVTTDTTRADRFGCYGSTGGFTPFIDELAENSVLFEQAQAPAPVTLPSHCSLFTGLYPMGHGVRNNGMFKLDQKFETLAEVFAEEGYATGAFISAQVLVGQYGLDQGFQVYDDDLSKSLKIGQTMVPSRRGNLTLESAEAWLRSVDEGTPVFLWLHLYDPHAPYDPPPEYRERWPNDPYGGEVAFVDDLVQQLVGTLREVGRWDQTVFTVLSDHGEALGEHGEATHGILLHQATIKVPWILRIPREIGPVRVNSPVSIVNLAPTLAGLAGVRIPNESSQDGANLLSSASRDSDALTEIYSEAMLPYFQYGWSPLRALRKGSWQIISGVRDELFELDRDPRELADRATTEPMQLEHLKVELDEAVASDSVEESAATLQISQSEREALEALGYAVTASVPREAVLDPRDVIDGHVQLERSRSLMSAGRVQEAIESIDAMLAKDPNNIAALSLKTNAYLAMNDLDAAESVAQKALDLDPKSSDTLLTLCRIEMMRGRFDRVIDLAEIGRRSRAPFGLFDATHARALINQGKVEQAAEVVESALESMPEDPDLLTTRATIELRRNDPADAEISLRKAVAADPFHKPARRQLAQLLMATDRTEDAVEMYQELLALSPGDVDALYGIGSIYLVKEPSKAVPYLEEAVRLAPGNADGLISLGVAYLKLRRLDEAESALRRALQIEPDNTDVRNNLAIIMIQKGDLEGAVGELKQLLEDNPDHLQALNNLAIAYGRESDFAAAESYAARALEIQPRFIDAWLTLASARHQRGALEDETRALESAYKLAPERPDVIMPLAVVSASTGRCDRTLQLVEQLTSPGTSIPADVLVAAGTCLERAGELEMALRNFEEAARISQAESATRREAMEGVQRISKNLR